MKKVLRGIARCLGILAAVIVLLALTLSLLALTETVDRAAVEGSADWMARLPDEMLLSEIVLPGSHDSATRFVQLAFFSKCQALSISEQLEAGCRYLDIRLGVDGHNGVLQLMHGFTRCKTGAWPVPMSDPLLLDFVLEDCYAFLTAHPTETVVFAVKQEHGEESAAEFQRMLDACVGEHPEFWLLTDSIPSLSDARGKLVLMRRYEDEAGLGASAGIPLIWEDQRGSENPSLHTVMHDQGSYRLWVQDRFEYNTAEKWTAFCDGMEAARAGIAAEDVPGAALNFLSTKGSFTYGHPWHFAKSLNRNLETLAPLSGWVILDFFDARHAKLVYEQNF